MKVILVRLKTTFILYISIRVVGQVGALTISSDIINVFFPSEVVLSGLIISSKYCKQMFCHSVSVLAFIEKDLP